MCQHLFFFFGLKTKHTNHISDLDPSFLDLVQNHSAPLMKLFLLPISRVQTEYRHAIQNSENFFI